MRVLVTGGTGYVGSHTVAALTQAGHEVTVLARSPDRVAPALEPLGVSGVATALGDVTDPASVERAMQGQEAVLHAASVFSMDARKADEMHAVNIAGTETVLGTAHRLGLDPIVHVSSELALLPPAAGAVLTPESPTGNAPTPYCRSKADSEAIARRFQQEGAPVVSLMPSAIWGPQDPHLGEGVLLCMNVLKQWYVFVMDGGMHISDVRDVARALAAVMEPRRGPRSYLVTGHYVTMKDIQRTLGEVTGRHLRSVTLPRGFVAGFGHVSDWFQRRVDTRLPWTFEGIWVLNCRARCDDSRSREELGLEPRDLRETFADTVRWLVSAGRLTPKQAGKLGEPATPAT
ncbi:MAG TPA: SDR family NAD(P)-dependent oxidoreductase [Actinomycetota bacterium]|nr:SDR family NAD(P)-dependent oxidoreductase [Actinomycetota bacterium]